MTSTAINEAERLLSAARHRMVDAYAYTLNSAGWARVERRGKSSRHPYLLAGGAPQA